MVWYHGQMPKPLKNPFAAKKTTAKKKLAKKKPLITTVKSEEVLQQASRSPQWQPSWTGQPFAAERFKHWVVGSNNVCIPAVNDDFTGDIQWKIFKIMAEFVEGFEFLSRLHKEVSVFGSARCSHKDPYYTVARKIGSLCAKNGYTMVTGGGPGMMEAANRGAYEAKGESVGLTIQLPMEQRTNKYVKRSVDFHYFFTRKVMLSASAQAYVFMPGGFGTLDELFEIVTLIQTGKMSDSVPVILVGKEFWNPLLGWIKKRVLDTHGYIAKGDLDIFHLVETAEEVFEIIKTTHERSL